MIDILKTYELPVKFYPSSADSRCWSKIPTYNKITDTFIIAHLFGASEIKTKLSIYNDTEDYCVISHNGVKNNNQQYNISASFTTYTSTTTRRSGYCPKCDTKTEEKWMISSTFEYCPTCKEDVSFIEKQMDQVKVGVDTSDAAQESSMPINWPGGYFTIPLSRFNIGDAIEIIPGGAALLNISSTKHYTIIDIDYQNKAVKVVNDFFTEAWYPEDAFRKV